MEKNITYLKSYSNFLILKLLLLAFILNQNTLQAQISYSCDMENTCGSNWDNSGFSDGASYTGGCSGDGLYDNVYGSGSYASLAAYNYNAITGHQGGDLTVTVKTKLRAYSSPYGDEYGCLY